MVKWSSGTVRFGLTPQTSLMQIHFLRTGRKWAWSVAWLSWVWFRSWVGRAHLSIECRIYCT